MQKSSLLDEMTDPMEVDLAAPPDGSHPMGHDQGMIQGHGSPPAAQKQDFIGLSESQKGGFVSITDEGYDRTSPEEDTENKQKMWSTSLKEFFSDICERLSGPRDSELKARLQIYDAEINDLQRANERLEKHNRYSNKQIQHLEETNQKVRRANKRLDQQIDEVERELQCWAAHAQRLEKKLDFEKDDHRKEIARLKNQINDATRKQDRLRQMIVPDSQQQVPDSDVSFKFSALCSNMVGLVRQTWKPEFKDPIDHKSLSNDQRHFFESRIPLSYDRLRSIVFEIIYYVIFSSQPYFLGGDHWDLERHIQKVEKALNLYSGDIDRGQLIEWRNATFKATEKLRDNGSCVSVITRDFVWDILGLLKMRNEAAEKNGPIKLKAICDDAVELALMIRQLKDDFRVELLAGAVGKPISEWEDEAEDVLSVPARKIGQSGTIAYVITGALVKNPKENPEKELKLQKAQVAVYQ